MWTIKRFIFLYRKTENKKNWKCRYTKSVGTLIMNKKILTSTIVLMTLGVFVVPTTSTVYAATNPSSEIELQNTTEEDASIGNIESINSYTDAANQYLTINDGVYILDKKAKDIMTSNDYLLLSDIVNSLNNPYGIQAKARANTFRLTLSNKQAKSLVYNLGKTTGVAGIVAIIAGLGGVTAIVGAAVAAGGITAGGLANQINYRNNGKGVTLDVGFTGITVKSR